MLLFEMPIRLLRGDTGSWIHEIGETCGLSICISSAYLDGVYTHGQAVIPKGECEEKEEEKV